MIDQINNHHNKNNSNNNVMGISNINNYIPSESNTVQQMHMLKKTIGKKRNQPHTKKIFTPLIQ